MDLFEFDGFSTTDSTSPFNAIDTSPFNAIGSSPFSPFNIDHHSGRSSFFDYTHPHMSLSPVSPSTTGSFSPIIDSSAFGLPSPVIKTDFTFFDTCIETGYLSPVESVYFDHHRQTEQINKPISLKLDIPAFPFDYAQSLYPALISPYHLPKPMAEFHISPNDTIAYPLVSVSASGPVTPPSPLKDIQIPSTVVTNQMESKTEGGVKNEKKTGGGLKKEKKTGEGVKKEKKPYPARRKFPVKIPVDVEQTPFLDLLLEPTFDEFGEKSFPCVCGKHFERLCGLKSHIKVHQTTGHKLVKTTTEQRPGSSSLTKHLIGIEWCHHGIPIPVVSKCEGERNFFCEFCSKNFLRKQDLRRHTQSNHSSADVLKKDLRCPCCKSNFSRSDALHRHVNSKRCSPK